MMYRDPSSLLFRSRSSMMYRDLSSLLPRSRSSMMTRNSSTNKGRRNTRRIDEGLGPCPEN
jgi:hypothetical protein